MDRIDCYLPKCLYYCEIGYVYIGSFRRKILITKEFKLKIHIISDGCDTRGILIFELLVVGNISSVVNPVLEVGDQSKRYSLCVKYDGSSPMHVSLGFVVVVDHCVLLVLCSDLVAFLFADFAEEVPECAHV